MIGPRSSILCRRITILCGRITILCGCIMLYCGCVTTEKYLISGDSLRRLQAMPVAERASLAVPATRQGKPVLVRGSTLQIDDASRSENSLEVKSRAPNRMMTAGSALTWIGTAISVAGTVLFLAFSDFDRHWAGAGLALSAEAVMWTGTGLWIAGAGRHPQELRSAARQELPATARQELPSETPADPASSR
jgi:hypothetical protein